MAFSGPIRMTELTNQVTLSKLFLEFFITAGSKGRQIRGLFGRIPVIPIKPMGVLGMTRHIVRTQKTFAGTGTDLSIQFGIS